MAYPTHRAPASFFYPWTEQAVADLRRMAEEGLSAFQIADALGRAYPGPQPTRNSVIGKCHRLGVKLCVGATCRTPAKPKAPRKPKVSPPKPVGAPKRGQASKLSDWVSSTFVAPTPVAVSPPPPKGSVALDDLSADQCRWPYGDKAPFMFCGCEAMAGKPYCKAHFTVGTIPMRAEKIRPPRDLHNVPVDFRRMQPA